MVTSLGFVLFFSPGFCDTPPDPATMLPHCPHLTRQFIQDPVSARAASLQRRMMGCILCLPELPPVAILLYWFTVAACIFSLLSSFSDICFSSTLCHLGQDQRCDWINDFNGDHRCGLVMGSSTGYRHVSYCTTPTYDG